MQLYTFITSEDELYARTIRTVHLIVTRQLSLNDMRHLLEMQSANGMVISYDHAGEKGTTDAGGLATWLCAGANVFEAQKRERMQSSLMKTLFPHGIPFGFMGDGSNDRSLAEQEAIVARHLDGNGRPYNEFYDLATLDLSKSADGRSPDADCIADCYETSLAKLNQYEGLLHRSDWKKAAVGVSFDGASVMMGSQNGVAKKMQDKSEGHLAVIHAVAHVEQLGNSDAFSEVEFYGPWRETVQETYVEYASSGKKRFSLEEVANELRQTLLKMGTTHGIRWAASQARTIKGLTTSLPSIVVDLEYRVKTQLGMHFTQLTPSNSFLRKTFTQKFTAPSTGRLSRWKATVVGFTPSPDGVAASDSFDLGYSDRTTLPMRKAELVAALTNLGDERLLADTRWLLREKLTDYGFNGFSAFMLDVHDQLSILSRSYQSNSLCVFDISRHLNKTLKAFKTLKSEPGPTEVSFLREVQQNDNADTLRTCQLYDGESGRNELKKNRILILDALISHLTARFGKVLDDPVLQAFAIFDKRQWPSDKEILKGYHKDEIELLYSKYQIFYTAEETLAHVQEQWEELKEEIRKSPGLMSRKFHDLWPHMLVNFSDEYPLVLRLVAISLLVPTDTSECERVFSLLNDLKTPERSTLCQENLRNLMLWHSFAKDLKCQDVPVLAILKEFHELSGKRGRNAHRGTTPPQYSYRVKVEVEEEK